MRVCVYVCAGRTSTSIIQIKVVIDNIWLPLNYLLIDSSDRGYNYHFHKKCRTVADVVVAVKKAAFSRVNFPNDTKCVKQCTDILKTHMIVISAGHTYTHNKHFQNARQCQKNGPWRNMLLLRLLFAFINNR